MRDRIGPIIFALLGVASLGLGLSLLLGFRTLDATLPARLLGMSGLGCGVLLLRISFGVERRRRA
jgi:hypothetical protein